ncbi:hypothetical protein MIR68_008913 [Amoeboaphelidium protococcarum]|nr:hypothetical protein MIR68_008913 [Amoeboaphelidium protococcarum]
MSQVQSEFDQARRMASRDQSETENTDDGINGHRVKEQLQNDDVCQKLDQMRVDSEEGQQYLGVAESMQSIVSDASTPLNFSATSINLDEDGVEIKNGSHAPDNTLTLDNYAIINFDDSEQKGVDLISMQSSARNSRPRSITLPDGNTDLQLVKAALEGQSKSIMKSKDDGSGIQKSMKIGGGLQLDKSGKSTMVEKSASHDALKQASAESSIQTGYGVLGAGNHVKGLQSSVSISSVEKRETKSFAGFLKKLKNRTTAQKYNAAALASDSLLPLSRRDSKQSVTDMLNDPLSAYYRQRIDQDRDITEVLDLLQKMVNYPKKYENWRSPVIGDEMYITDILFYGDIEVFSRLSPSVSTASNLHEYASKVSSASRSLYTVNDNSESSGSSGLSASAEFIPDQSDMIDNAYLNMSKSQNVDNQDESNACNRSQSLLNQSFATVALASSSNDVPVYLSVSQPSPKYQNLKYRSLDLSNKLGNDVNDSISAGILKSSVNSSRMSVRTSVDSSLLRRQSLLNAMKAPKLPKKPVPTKGIKSNLDDVNSSNKSLKKFNSCTTLFSIDNSLYTSIGKPEYLDVTLKVFSYAVSQHLERTYAFWKILNQFDDAKKKASRRSSSASVRPNSLMSSPKLGAKSTFPKEVKLPPNHEHHLASRCFKSVDIFSEKLNPLWKVRYIPDEVQQHPEIMQPPTQQELYHFLKQLFYAADLTAEVAIVSLIYMERLLEKTKISLHGLNVFRALLSSVMMAANIWDDQAVWNVDFKTIMQDLRLSGLNQMEKWWLKTINWNISVKKAQFASYWFEIRECAEKEFGDRVKLFKNQQSSSAAQNGSKSPTSLVEVNTKRQSQVSAELRADHRRLSKQLSQTKAFQDQASSNGQGIRSASHKSLSRSSTSQYVIKKATTVPETERQSDPLVPSKSLTISIEVGSFMKPLTEQQMEQLATATTYSQTKIRQDFSNNLKAPSNMSSQASNLDIARRSSAISSVHVSHGAISLHTSNFPVYGNVSERLYVPDQQSIFAKRFSVDSKMPQSKQDNALNHYLRPSSAHQNRESGKSKESVSEEVAYNVSGTQRTLNESEEKPVLMSKLNQHVDIKWGGNNLRRAKSDNIFHPAIPAASVI